MRRIITNIPTALCALLLAAPALRAETAVDDPANDEDPQMGLSDQATDDAAFDDAAEVSYNRWICHAQPRGIFSQRYFGYSQWFQGGSGAGQQAHQYAYQRALNNCRYRYGRRCYSDFQRDCYVDRR